MLLLPVNTRFLVSLRHVDLGGFTNAASGLGVVFYAARRLNVSPSSAEVMGFAGSCTAAILVHDSLMFLMATISFWTVRATRAGAQLSIRDRADAFDGHGVFFGFDSHVWRAALRRYASASS